MFTPLPLGLALVLIALGLWFRRSLAAAEGAEHGPPPAGTWVPGALGLALACAGAAELLIARRVLPVPLPLLAPAPSNPLLLPGLLLATASLLSPLRGSAHRAWGSLQLALLLTAPLLAALPHLRFLLPPAALLLALVALHGLLASTRPARLATAGIALVLFALASLHAPPAAAPPPPEEDELVAFTALPPNAPALAGTLSTAVPSDTVRVRFDPLPPLSSRTPRAVTAPLAPAQGSVRPFELPIPTDLRPGAWSATLEVLAPDGTVLGRRYATTLDVPPPWPARVRALVRWLPALATLLLLLLLSERVQVAR